jgi:hypothetical protein
MEIKPNIKCVDFYTKYHTDPEFRKRHIARVRACKAKKHPLGHNRQMIEFIKREITVVFK